MPSITSDLRGRRLLVVDDDGDFVEYMRSLLAGYGASEIVSASCGVEALDELARRRDLDLVLTDQRMPTPSGVQLVAMARTAGFREPFLIVTAFPDDEINAAVARLERAAVLGKPFVPLDLLHAATDLIEVSH
jgi:CheY-like chemotaxis protein